VRRVSDQRVTTEKTSDSTVVKETVRNVPVFVPADSASLTAPVTINSETGKINDFVTETESEGLAVKVQMTGGKLKVTGKTKARTLQVPVVDKTTEKSSTSDKKSTVQIESVKKTTTLWSNWFLLLLPAIVIYVLYRFKINPLNMLKWLKK
jgi:hypothetical protein